jgi:hypothetical protein
VPQSQADVLDADVSADDVSAVDVSADDVFELDVSGVDILAADISLADISKTKHVPTGGVSMPFMQESRVLLPEPFAPIIQTYSFSYTVKDIASKAFFAEPAREKFKPSTFMRIGFECIIFISMW